MANYNNLANSIQTVIKTNGNQEITGDVLQQALLALIASMGAAGFLFKGKALVSTDPGTPDQNVFYIAEAGTYVNFNNITVPENHIGILSYNGSWSASTLQTGTQTEIADNCETDDPTKALSAKQGVVLDEKIGNLDEKTSTQKLPIYRVIGKGNTLSDGIITTDLTPGRSYRLYIKSWDRSGVTYTSSSYVLLRVASDDSQEVATYLVDIATNKSLASYYDITVPADSARIRIFGRVTDGMVGEVVVQDITDIVLNDRILGSLNTSPVDSKLAGAELSSDLSVNEGYVVETITSVEGQSLNPFSMVIDTQKYGTNNSYKHLKIPVHPGDIVKVKGNSSSGPRVAFLTDFYESTSGGTVRLVDGTVITQLYANQVWFFLVPEGTACVAITIGEYNSETESYGNFPALLEIYRKLYNQPVGDVIPIDSYRMKPGSNTIISYAGRGSWTYPLYPGREYKFQHIAAEGVSTTDYFAFTDTIPSIYTPTIDYGDVVASYDYMLVFTVDKPMYLVAMAAASRLSLTSRILEEVQPKVRQDLDALISNTRFDEIELSGSMGGYISSTDNTFIISANYKGYALIPISGGKFLKIIANADKNTRYAFLKDNVIPSSTHRCPNFVDFRGTESVPPGTQAIVQIPADANYLYVYHGYTDNNFTPDFIGISTGEVDIPSDESLMVFDEIDITGLKKYSYWINNSNKYGTGSNYKHVLINVSNVKYVKIHSQEGNSAQVAWFTQIDTPASGGIPPLVPGTGVTYIPADTEAIVKVPEGAVMMYLYLYANASYIPKYVGIYTDTDDQDEFDEDFNSRADRQNTSLAAIGLTPLTPPVDENGWELPTTLQQLNAQKKAEQLVKIRWTPKLNVPSKSDPNGIFEAGVEVTVGIPYSSNNDDGSKTVGEEVLIHTFMTALNNPYSLIYTECVNNGNKWPGSGYPNAPTKCSGWGKEYTLSSNGFAYYGTVCCGFTSSVENAPLKWNNPVMRDYKKTNGVYVPVCPSGTVNFELLKIGDICDNDAHSFMIYGLHRDENGLVDKVKIAESSSGIGGKGGCHITTFNSRSAFESHINRAGDPFTVFRYINLWDNTDYEPSEYVPLTNRGEEETTITYNDAICTFAGDKAAFREGDLVVINYNLNGVQPYTWTKIKVYKGDTLLREYTLDEAEQSLLEFYANGGDPIVPQPFNPGINQHNHALVLGTELEGGLYKACMSDGTNDSEFTYWEVLSAPLTVIAKNPDNYTVKVGGTNEIQVVYINGMYYIPTPEEKASRRFIVHIASL